MKIPAIATKFLNEYFRYTAGAVALLVAAAGYLFLLAPKISSLQTGQVAARKNAEAELVVQRKYADALRTSNAKFTATLSAEKQQQLNNFIPSDSDFPGLMLTVKNIVSQAQLVLDSIAVGQTGQVATGTGAAAPAAGTKTSTGAQAAAVTGTNLRTQEVTIAVSGGTSYEGFKRLLALFESSQRMFDVISVNYTTAAATAEGATAAAAQASWSLVLRTYYLPTNS